MGQAVGDEAGDAAVKLFRIVPDQIHRQDPLIGFSQGSHDPTPALTVSAGPCLGGPSRAVPGGAAALHPAAVFPDGAAGAGGLPGDA